MRLAPLNTGARVAANTEALPVAAPFLINEPLVSLVRFLKFEGGRRAAWPLSWWMSRSLERAIQPGPDAALVPIPLHGARLAARGYNQAALLAEGVSILTGIPVLRTTVRRNRRTRPQSKLDAADRAGNVRGAFTLRRGEDLEGRIAIVVDDLVTTGATAAACAEALRGAGPSLILVLAAGTAVEGGKIPLKTGAGCA
jgi:ComF family protein